MHKLVLPRIGVRGRLARMSGVENAGAMEWSEKRSGPAHQPQAARSTCPVPVAAIAPPARRPPPPWPVRTFGPFAAEGSDFLLHGSRTFRNFRRSEACSGAARRSLCDANGRPTGRRSEPDRRRGTMVPWRTSRAEPRTGSGVHSLPHPRHANALVRSFHTRFEGGARWPPRNPPRPCRSAPRR
jgi:hypothetical protein